MRLFLIGAGVLMLAYTVYKTQKINRLTVCLKMLCSTAFLAIPIVGDGLVGEWGYAQYVFVGLIFAFWGDFFLELKLLSPSNDASYSYLGFGAFIFTHLCYLMALNAALQPQFGLWTLTVCVALAIVALVKLTERPMGLDYGRFRPITLVYTAILGSSFTLSVLLAWQLAPLPLWLGWFTAGVVLFLLSDLALSQLYFGPKRWVKSHIAANCLTYYLGQFAIAYSTVLYGVLLG